MYSHELVLYCKSYLQDFKLLERSISSLQHYNVDDIPVVISCPQTDLKYLPRSVSDYATLCISDEEMLQGLDLEPLASNPLSLSVGYMKMQLCKLRLYVLELARFYVSFDSDVIFTSEFLRSTFIGPNQTPLVAYSDDRLINSNRYYLERFGENRNKLIKSIGSFFDLKPQDFYTAHGNTLMDSECCRYLEQLLSQKSTNIVEQLSRAPLETTWHHACLQSSAKFTYRLVPSQFLTVHTFQELLAYYFSNLNIELARTNYTGIIFNSNWCPYSFAYSLPVVGVRLARILLIIATMTNLHRVTPKLIKTTLRNLLDEFQ